MKPALVVAALALAGSTPALAADRIGERCTGTETLQVGAKPPTHVPYTLSFSADLAAGTYCYDRCGADQSYRISEARSNPVKLANLHRGGQERLLTFDRRTAALSDDQRFESGLGRVVRKAQATCVPAAFHQPVVRR
ncbi:hypothetical protein TPR58_20855 [Sphingomonas sp. HF-S3]|uniref:Uncharacterized protein n=1 Tax=Sphingomonas rustica TaxID=3103142 RepID=A0ABV0BG59_9SPHN